jgi:hypothetical protein
MTKHAVSASTLFVTSMLLLIYSPRWLDIQVLVGAFRPVFGD